MERIWPLELDHCKLCKKPKLELLYKGRGLCESCFKKVQNNGVLRSYPRYPEDRTKAFDGRQRTSKKLADLIYCIRNVGVGEIADCLKVEEDVVRDWVEDTIPDEYVKSIQVMKKSIMDEVYEFKYPDYKIEPWSRPGDCSYEISV